MRLKQLLAVLIATLLCVTWAAASGQQLTNVNVVAQKNSTTVTLRATGTFGHNEYRANDALLLVDLTGVSAGQMHERERTFEVPGVKSYRVVGYKGMGNVEVARLELRLTTGAEAKVREIAGGVAIDVTPSGAVDGTVASEPVTAAVATPSVTKPRVTEQPSVPNQAEVVQVQQISVMRGKPGMAIEITGSGAMKANVMKLESPDRIVLDIANAVPAGRPRPILVNSGAIKAVRMAQYQAAPPVTRIVVDALAAQDFELDSAGNKLILKLRPAAPQDKAAGSAPSAAAPVTNASSGAPRTEVEKAAVPVAHKAAATPVVVPAVEKKVVQQTALASLNQASQPVQNVTSVEQKAAASRPSSGRTAKGDADSPSAQPVVFVEPSYAPKTESGDKSVDKAAAAQPSQTIAQNAPVAQSQPAVQLPVAQNQAPADESKSQQAVNFAQEQQRAVGQKTQQTRYTGEPISVNLKDVDLKDFFRLVHEISGLNVVLDPGVAGTLTLVLDDVPWDQALDIVLKNNALDKQLDGNVLRIATIDDLRKEAQARRLQLEAQALAVEKVNVTRFLSYAQAKDVLPTVKKLLSARGEIVADARTNGLVIQDIPSIIPEVDRLLTQLDRKTQEVEIEARVVAATRTFARDIGTQLGFGWGGKTSAVGGVPAVGNSPLIDTVAKNPLYFLNDKLQIPLFSNLAPTGPTSGLSFLNATSAYRLDMVLSMAESRGLLKILSRPRVVTQNNKEALVKQGFRIPVVTMGQLGGPPSVTYLEAVLRLTVTPQITVENTIFLNVDIENTTPDFSRQILGNPVFLTQQATTQVLVTDGGTVLIGGVIQTQNSVNVQQVPLLGNVPVLGNLFKHRSVQNSTQELIFILTPKIVQT